MNGNQSESFTTSARTARDALLLVTENRIEIEIENAWAHKRNLYVERRSTREIAERAVSKALPAVRVVEWPRGVDGRGFIAALRESGAGATVLIVPEDVHVDLDGQEIPDSWDLIRRPCDPRELIWRADRALSRLRHDGSVSPLPPIVSGPLCHDRTSGEIRAYGVPLALRRAERDVLLYLMRQGQRLSSAKELQREVLRSNGNGAAARNQVYELRRKLSNAGLVDAIVSKGRGGYRLRWPG